MNQKQVGRYEIIEAIGRGGMANVYLAYDPRFERQVAVKLLSHELTREPAFRARFQREARTIAGLDHPAIVPVYDFGEEDGQLYLVMRHMTGGSLARRLKSESPFSLTKAAQIIQRIAPALDEAHDKGIIHRDIKPANILFDQRGNVFLSDFGIAKTTEGTLTITGNAIVGTPAYMSPEQARGDADLDGRSDIYALGILLFQMLTGQLPYESDTPMGLAVKQITEPPPHIRTIRADLPIAIEKITLKAMAKQREDRYETVTALATAVAHAAYAHPPANSDTVFLVDEPPDRTAAAATKVSIWQIGGVIGLVLLAIYGGFVLFNQNDSSPATPIPVAIVDTATATATETMAATATATAVPTLTPTATATFTPMPTDTAVSPTTLVPISCPEPQVRILFSSVSVRSGPGVAYDLVDYMFADETTPVIASNAAGSWYNVKLSETSGWVSSEVAELIYDDTCPSIEIAATIPAAPTSTITPFPSATPTSPPPEDPRSPSTKSPGDIPPTPPKIQ